MGVGGGGGGGRNGGTYHTGWWLGKDRGGEEVHEKFCVWEVGEGEVVRARVNITIKSMN